MLQRVLSTTLHGEHAASFILLIGPIVSGRPLSFTAFMKGFSMSGLRRLLMLCSFFFSALTVATASAQLADNSGNFSNYDEGAPPNTDSDSVPGLQMMAPSYSGTGCPQGSVSATLSPNGTSLSLLFDAYVTEAGGTTGQLRTAKNCQINIPFTVPPGYAVQVVKMDYRGFVSVPNGARSTFGAGFRFLEINGRGTNSRRVLRASVLTGPRQENFVLSSIVRGPEFSPCGRSFVLAAESMLNVQSNRAGESAVSTIDSLDATQTPMIYSLRWKRCGGHQGPGPDGPHPGPRPPRPRWGR